MEMKNPQSFDQVVAEVALIIVKIKVFGLAVMFTVLAVDALFLNRSTTVASSAIANSAAVVNVSSIP